MTRHRSLSAQIKDFRVETDSEFDPDRLPRFQRHKNYGTPQATNHLTRSELNTLGHKQEKKPLLVHRLNERLSKSGFEWNILAVEMFGPDLNRENYLTHIKHYCQKNKIQTEGRITFAFNSSTGDPITPWMVCHKIGHALLSVGNVSNIYGTIESSLLAPRFNQLSVRLQNNQNQIMTMRSVQTLDPKQQPSSNELSYELVAQYLMTGKIVFKVPEQLVYGPEGNRKTIPNDYFDAAKAQQVARWIENEIKNLLKQSVSKILVDYL